MASKGLFTTTRMHWACDQKHKSYWLPSFLRSGMKIHSIKKSKSYSQSKRIPNPITYTYCTVMLSATLIKQSCDPFLVTTPQLRTNTHIQYSQTSISKHVSTHPAHKCAVKIHGCQNPAGGSSCLIYVSLHQGDNCQAFKLKSHSLKTEEVRQA